MHKEENSHTETFKGVALVSAPWPLFNRPSVQLGTLKAYLISQFPDLKIEAHHFYLKIAEQIGYKRYQAISQGTWLAESVYAALLFPERLERIKKRFRKEATGKPLLRGIDLEMLTAQVRDASEAFISNTNWGDFGLVGFSVCLCQLTSSLYLIRQIKQKYPNLAIVVGGSVFSGDAARNLTQAFPGIDFVINGEGELPLAQLIRNRSQSPVVNHQPPRPSDSTFCQMENLNHLPLPDYDDYFHLLSTFGPKRSFFPILPVEMSRGCWWRKTRDLKLETRNLKLETRNSKFETPNSELESCKAFAGCAFCNLNLQWEGYRAKEPSQVISEIDELTSRYKLLSVAVMDNVSPVKTSEEIFSRLGQLNKDFDFFCELRASTPHHVLASMKAAGVSEVQIGIEALSTRLLKTLNKGTTAIQNLEMMKNCEALGIANNSNLILQFPGSNPEDVAETLRALDFAMPFRPLKCVRFWLGLESPVWQNPRAFGIKAVFNHPNYASLFPRHIVRTMTFMIQAYRGDMGYQKKLWQPVRKKVIAWKKAYAELHRRPFRSPILSFREGQTFLIIHQRQVKGDPLIHRLVGTSKEIYLFCQQHRSVETILANFPSLTQEKIMPFLGMMADKRLMFEEDGKYLSLAVPVNPSKT